MTLSSKLFPNTAFTLRRIIGLLINQNILNPFNIYTGGREQVLSGRILQCGVPGSCDTTRCKRVLKPNDTLP